MRAYTEDICAALSAMEKSPWKTANRGKGVDGHYLREHLAGFLPDQPEKIAPRRWREGKANPRFGYHERHFEDALTATLAEGCLLKRRELRTETTARAQRPKIIRHIQHIRHKGQKLTVAQLFTRAGHRQRIRHGTPVSDTNPMNSVEASKVPDIVPDERNGSDTEKSAESQTLIGNVSDVWMCRMIPDPPPARARVAPDTPSVDQNKEPVPGADEWVAKPAAAPRKPNGAGRPAVSFPRGAQSRRKRETGARPAQ